MKRENRLIRRIGTMGLALATIGLLARCGSERSKKDGDGTPQTRPSSLPADWDGVSDWSHSVFEVADE